jgi:hypothetical protein
MILKKRSWSDFECKFKVNQMDSDVILGACSLGRRMFPRASYVSTSAACSHELSSWLLHLIEVGFCPRGRKTSNSLPSPSALASACSHERRMFPRAELVATILIEVGFCLRGRILFQFTTIPFGLVFCPVEAQTENPQSKSIV